MISVFGVPTCDKITHTQSLLNSNSIDFTFINVRKSPISKDELKNIIDQLGLEVVLNKRGMLYRKLGLKKKNLSDQQLFNELLNEQGMIKRPLIKKGDKYHSGYDEEAIIMFLK